MNSEHGFDPSEAERAHDKINADVEAQQAASEDTPGDTPTIETTEKAKLTPEDLLAIGQDARAERGARIAKMAARVDKELAKPEEEKDAAPEVGVAEGAELTDEEAVAIADEAAARIEAVRGDEDEFQKGLGFGEKKFFAEGAKLNEETKLEHAHAAVQMGYKETPEGDLVRGNAVSQELGQLGREVSELTERLEAAEGLLEATKGWWGRMKGRREIAKLKKELGEKNSEMDLAKARVVLPERAAEAAKARAERRG